jgi:hypothetical protein
MILWCTLYNSTAIGVLEAVFASTRNHFNRHSINTCIILLIFMCCDNHGVPYLHDLTSAAASAARRGGTNICALRATHALKWPTCVRRRFDNPYIITIILYYYIIYWARRYNNYTIFYVRSTVRYVVRIVRCNTTKIIIIIIIIIQCYYYTYIYLFYYDGGEVCFDTAAKITRAQRQQRGAVWDQDDVLFRIADAGEVQLRRHSSAGRAAGKKCFVKAYDFINYYYYSDIAC